MIKRKTTTVLYNNAFHVTDLPQDNHVTDIDQWPCQKLPGLSRAFFTALRGQGHALRSRSVVGRQKGKLNVGEKLDTFYSHILSTLGLDLLKGRMRTK